MRCARTSTVRLRTLFFALLPLAACGGAGAPPAASATGATHGAATTETAPASPADDANSAPRCDDGSCFPCGGGVCPSGFYCAVDRAHQGCAWIPKCASKSSCECLAPVTKLDASCACEERGGGVYVTCGG